MFNDLQIPEMEQVTELYELKGDFINLTYTLPSGQKVQLWDNDKIYYGAELHKDGSGRCYGLTADEHHLLVCEYGVEGCDAEIVIYKRI